MVFCHCTGNFIAPGLCGCLTTLAVIICIHETFSSSTRCFQRFAPIQHNRSPSPDQPDDAHYHHRSPHFPPTFLQLGHPFARKCRPHLPQLQPRRSCSSGTGAPGVQRCQCHPCHHSGPPREQHLSGRVVGRQPGCTPHPPDPWQCAILCLKAVHHHQLADPQSIWSNIHGHELQVRLCSAFLICGR